MTLGTLLARRADRLDLELNGLLGYDAIVAGRFTGYGNLTFGLLSVSVLSVTAAVATGCSAGAPAERARRGDRRDGPSPFGFLTVAVIGAPGLGRDFGGVLAALPGFLLLAMLLARIRVTVVGWWRSSAPRSSRWASSPSSTGRGRPPTAPTSAGSSSRCSPARRGRSSAARPRRTSTSCWAARWPGCCRSRWWPRCGWCVPAVCCAPSGPAAERSGGLSAADAVSSSAPVLLAGPAEPGARRRGQRLRRRRCRRPRRRCWCR